MCFCYSAVPLGFQLLLECLWILYFHICRLSLYEDIGRDSSGNHILLKLSIYTHSPTQKKNNIFIVFNNIIIFRFVSFCSAFGFVLGILLFNLITILYLCPRYAQCAVVHSSRFARQFFDVSINEIAVLVCKYFYFSAAIYRCGDTSE